MFIGNMEQTDLCIVIFIRLLKEGKKRLLAITASGNEIKLNY